MRLRRCTWLLIEPFNERRLDLAGLFAGAARLEERRGWRVLAAHQDAPIEVSTELLPVLAAISSERWSERAALIDAHSESSIAALQAMGLLIEESECDVREPAGLKDWNGLNAVAWRHSRWRGIDAQQAASWLGDGAESAQERLGPPPPVVGERGCAPARIPLQRCQPDSGIDRLLDARATCRNFDASRPLSIAVFAELLQRVYAASALSRTSDVPVIKRGVASAGGLHPVEAYLLVQRVEGLAPGLYHYHPVEHALQPLQTLGADPARDLAARFVAQQHWFADAAVMAVLVARFARNHWKYRRHAKSYRAMVLDAGHLSHQQYLVATELGLGAFITAAINEGDVEDAFGLDPMEEGVLAVTGFGYRGATMQTLEFDPLRQVWPEWEPE